MSRQELLAKFRRRTKEARESTDMSQARMAEALDLDENTYARYENRTPLPHYLIDRFCIITRVSHSWLISGREEPVGAGKPKKGTPPNPRTSRKAS